MPYMKIICINSDEEKAKEFICTLQHHGFYDSFLYVRTIHSHICTFVTR